MGMAVEGAKLATTYGVTVTEEGFWGQALKFVTLNQSAGGQQLQAKEYRIYFGFASSFLAQSGYLQHL